MKTKKMDRTLKIGLHNRFDVFVKNHLSGEEKQVAYAENIILNQAWTYLIPGAVREYFSGWFTHINYGEGTGALSAARTTLFTQIASVACGGSTYNYDTAENWFSHRRSILIDVGTSTGKFITEVGIYNTNDSKLMTHALLKDMNGNPVSIEKGDLDSITIYATVYLVLSGAYSPTSGIDVFRTHPAYNDFLAQVMGGRVTYYSGGISRDGGSLRAMAVYPYSDPPSVLSRHVSDTSYYSTTGITALWTSDIPNKRLTLYKRLAPAEANSAGLGVKSIVFCQSSDNYNYNSNGIIIRYPNDDHVQSTIIEQIGTGDGLENSFKTTFPFVKTGAVIKVDGTPVSATVHLGLPNKQSIIGYMRKIYVDNGVYLIRNHLFPSAPTGDTESVFCIENPFYVTHGIDSIKYARATLYTSDNLTDWTQVATTTLSGQTYNVDAGHKQKRYWKILPNGNYGGITDMICTALDNFKNVVIDTPPAVGAAITAEYNTDVAAKDVNHVLDINITIQFGEYTEE